MNERIKSLWNKAAEMQSCLNPTDWDAQVKFLNDFATVIVQDCIEELEVSKKGDIYTGDLFDCEWNDCIDRQIEMLKEEFGVK